MPFLSPDWRCPGDKWIKSSEDGNTWENAKDWREKVFANMNDAALKRIYRQSLTDDRLSTEDFESMLANIVCFQPHIRINLYSTREIATVSTITDALLKLDMKSAIRDVRRFNYVCKLVRRLLADRLHTMTGRSQLYIIELLKVIMHQVLGSCNQTLVFRQLLDTLRTNLERHEYDHIGSSQLWANHWESLTKMKATLDDFDIKQTLTNNADKHSPHRGCIRGADSRSESGQARLENLPLECLKLIVANVNSPEDLESASVASPTLALVVNDEVFWRRLATRSFTPNQIMSVQFGRASWKAVPADNGARDCNWRRAYIRLLRRFGEQQVHSACLGICENCSCLYWMLLGHPCYRQEKPPRVRLLSPENFIALFAK
ncbi:F-box only protein 32 [Echinococcus granulosus]|uniref:F-box only protein 32 n=1 Tax=Echinococcus granulosus TaxID=6210 RepID=U6IZ45_ECHGR|nr:F-box only protein 32 [Echinococcus granulosus]EUB62491.1 F-box only protein 32 [Echinococcus granulosus]KAH9283810.1 F-box only protein 32 [Echinococcus granulosus]CDS17079.1 f box only protein 32 [Echinococcus granulosus]